MRPSQLHLQFFGPYRETTIDFNHFNQTPLFLISGKTGSGKTTIFDGMCYALFDQTSGGDRQPQAMRSDFATNADLTQVTFTFTHRNRSYEIVRQPQQWQQKKRGEGLREAPASVTLTVWENQQEVTQLTKINQVKDYLEELLQMDGRQFAQIVLLPQGQFRRFLVAPSDEKATVLQQLFDTRLFAQWAAELKDQLRRQERQNQAALASVAQLEGELHWNDDRRETAQTLLTQQQTADLLALMAQQQTDTQAVQQAAQGELTKAQAEVSRLTRQDAQEEQFMADQAALTAAQQARTDLASDEPKMTALQATIIELTWVQTLQAPWQTWQRALQDVTTRTTAQQTAQAALLRAQQTAKEASQQREDSRPLQKKITMLATRQAQQTAIQPLYEQIAQLEHAQQTAQGNATAALQAQQAAQDNLTNTQRQRAVHQTTIAAQHDLYQEQQRLLQQQQTVREQQQKATTLQQLQQTIEAQARQLTEQATALTAAKAQATAAQEHVTALNQQRLRHQIAELSAQLTPGSPCPVCGATSHPQPAATQVATQAVTMATVQQAQKLASAKQQVVVTLTTQQEQLAQAQREQQTQAQVQLNELQKDRQQPTALLNALSTAISEDLTQLAEQLTENKQALVAVDQAQDQLTILDQTATQQQAVLVQTQEDHQKTQATLERVTAQLAAQRQRLPQGAGTLSEFHDQVTTTKRELAATQQCWQTVDELATQRQKQAAIAATQATSAQVELTQSQQQLASAVHIVNEQITAHGLTVTPETMTQLATQLTAVATLEEKRATLQHYHEQQQRVTTTIDALNQRLAGQAVPDRNATKERLTLANQRVTAVQERFYAAQELWQHNADLVKRITAQVADHATAMAQTRQLSELAGVLNGDGPNSKLGLERYVLQTYLRQILTVGNQRLKQLTNGRYQFVIDDAPAVSKKRSGLEINVYDDNVGEQRSVHTLSGGESFIAALALALALGEVIQRTTGSVDVEALFIDEGFGSLDEDALETALDSLETVEGKHRMIGIISHVSELRTRVLNQLQVVANGNGESHVRYQTPAD